MKIMEIKNVKTQITKYLILLCFSLMIILAASIRVNAEETAASGSEATMKRIELPEEVYNYDYYIYLNGLMYYDLTSSYYYNCCAVWAEDVVIAFNSNGDYDNIAFYASYAGAVSDSYKTIIPYIGKNGSTTYKYPGCSSSFKGWRSIFEAFSDDIVLVSGKFHYINIPKTIDEFSSDDITILYDLYGNGDASISSDFKFCFPYISLYNSDFESNFYTSFYHSTSINKDVILSALDFIYPNGYNVENMSQFKNQINTNIPIFDINSYVQQYCSGDMTEGWMLTTAWNKSDLVSVPPLLKDNTIANITGVDKALTTIGEEYVLGLYVDDINKYTEMDFKYSISYYSNDKTLIGSWGDEDLGYIFPTSPTCEYWYNVELKKTVEEAGFTFDLENYYFEGLVTIQFREEFNNSTYSYSNIFKLNFTINSSGLLVESKQVSVGSNGNANSTVDKDWTIGSGSGMGDFIDTSGSSGSGGIDLSGGSAFSSTVFSGLTETMTSMGSFLSLMSGLFSFLPVELILLIGFFIIALCACACCKALMH